MHVHIIGKPHMVEAFKAAQAQARLFAGKPMVPGINVVKPKSALVA
jgi:hypothetical protein